jgi:peptidoglycan hydrolase-like protein with peptidoglycan-binding domain
MVEIATKICVKSKHLIKSLFSGSVVWNLLFGLPCSFDFPSVQAQTQSSKASHTAPSTNVKTPTTTSTSSKKRQGKKRVAGKRPPRGQREIEASRVIEIQSALASAGFYKEQPSGKWDPSTTQAMTAYQESNGFKVTGKPDALSLKKLGL